MHRWVPGCRLSGCQVIRVNLPGWKDARVRQMPGWKVIRVESYPGAIYPGANISCDHQLPRCCTHHYLIISLVVYHRLG